MKFCLLYGQLLKKLSLPEGGQTDMIRSVQWFVVATDGTLARELEHELLEGVLSNVSIRVKNG